VSDGHCSDCTRNALYAVCTISRAPKRPAVCQTGHQSSHLAWSTQDDDVVCCVCCTVLCLNPVQHHVKWPPTLQTLLSVRPCTAWKCRTLWAVSYSPSQTTGQSLSFYHRHSHHPRTAEGDIVFSSVCLVVCLSVYQHDNSWTVRDIITKFSGHHPMVGRADKFENGYTGVYGWWVDVSGVLAYAWCTLPTPTRLSYRVKSRRRRRRRCVRNSQLAHDDCRRIRSTIWNLDIAIWLRQFWSITFSTMTSLCRQLSPTAQEIVNWVTTADGWVHTSDTTQLDSWVASAPLGGVYRALCCVHFVSLTNNNLHISCTSTVFGWRFGLVVAVSAHHRG